MVDVRMASGTLGKLTKVGDSYIPAGTTISAIDLEDEALERIARMVEDGGRCLEVAKELHRRVSADRFSILIGQMERVARNRGTKALTEEGDPLIERIKEKLAR